MTNVYNNAVIDDNETDRALYCVSGGTLCKIIKVHKRRISNKQFNDKQRARAKVVLQTAGGFAVILEEVFHWNGNNVIEATWYFPSQSLCLTSEQ